MSWKDIKIGKKLYIGFGIVLVLAAAIGFVAWNGLNTVSENVILADDANRLIKITSDMRISEKNYIMRYDDKYIDELHEHLATGIQEANDMIAKLDEQADIDAIEKGLAFLQEYKVNADKWITLHKDGKDAIAEMVTAGRLCEHQCENLRASQKEQMDAEFLSRETHDKLHDRIDKADDANRMLKWTLQMRRHEKNFIIRKDNQYIERISKLLADIKEQCETTKAKMKNQENRDQIDAVLTGTENYDKALQTYQVSYKELIQTEEKMVAAARNTVEICNESRAVMKGKMENAETTAITMAISFVVGAILIGVFVAFIIARGISKPVSEMAFIAQEISTGDINHNIELHSKDEIGALAGDFRKLIDYMKELSGAAESIAANDLTISIEPKAEKDVLGTAFKTMIANLSTMIRQLTDNATELVSAATEISSSAEQISRGSQGQMEQVTQVTSAVEEMTATIVESSKNAADATDGAKGAADQATDGGQIVNETIQGMQRIAEVVRESSDSIGKLAKSAEEIGQVIGVIDEIADQTNLLALNAAIEAARAGEHGRGFAVVADEVRKLAERSGKATGEIADMIKGIQQGTEESVQSMEVGIKEVDKGRELSDKAGNSLTEIVNMNQRVMDMIQQIATASEEQSSAAEQISRNIESVASITKESAAGAEQAATAAEELNRQAEGLKNMVGQFKINNQTETASVVATKG